MGPKRSSTSTNSRLPVKAKTPYGMGRSAVTDYNDSAASPHDSLASNDNKATGYFLQFTPAKTSPVKSPTKPAPGKFTPTRTTPTTKSTPTKSSPLKSSLPRTPPTKPKPFTFQTASRSRPTKRQGPTDTKTRIPKLASKSPTKSNASKSAQVELKRPPPSGFRTRSVSPKVLKPQDRFTLDNQTTEDMQIVADKCNALLDSFGGDNSPNIDPVHSRIDSDTDNRHSQHQITCVNTSKSEVGDKRTNNRLGAEPSSESIVTEPHSFIDPLSSNINNTANTKFTFSTELTEGDAGSTTTEISDESIITGLLAAQPNEDNGYINQGYSQRAHTSPRQKRIPTRHPNTVTTLLSSNHNLQDNKTQPSLTATEQSSRQLSHDNPPPELVGENNKDRSLSTAFLSSERCQELEPLQLHERCDDLTEDVIECSSVIIGCRKGSRDSKAEVVRAGNDLCSDSCHREAERDCSVSSSPQLHDRNVDGSSSSLDNSEEERTPAFSDSSEEASLPTQPESSGQIEPTATKMASSSWMDRLKEVCMLPNLLRTASLQFCFCSFHIIWVL